MRVLYTPDNLVYIGNTYVASFDNFNNLCAALGIINPIEQGNYCFVNKEGYTYINEKGHNSETMPFKTIDMEDSKKAAFISLLDKEDDFLHAVAEQVANKRAELEQEKITQYKALPLEDKLRNEYNKKYSYSEQIEALRDALNGNTTKLVEINDAFRIIKTEVLSKETIK